MNDLEKLFSNKKSKTKLVNIRNDKYDVYIGRPSKWGNPYSHKNNTIAKFKTNNRKESIMKYKDWITNGDGKYLLNDLHELKDKKLGCWCTPKMCHGDILLDIINQTLM